MGNILLKLQSHSVGSCLVLSHIVGLCSPWGTLKMNGFVCSTSSCWLEPFCQIGSSPLDFILESNVPVVTQDSCLFCCPRITQMSLWNYSSRYFCWSAVVFRASGHGMALFTEDGGDWTWEFSAGSAHVCVCIRGLSAGMLLKMMTCYFCDLINGSHLVSVSCFNVLACFQPYDSASGTAFSFMEVERDFCKIPLFYCRSPLGPIWCLWEIAEPQDLGEVVENYSGASKGDQHLELCNWFERCTLKGSRFACGYWFYFTDKHFCMGALLCSVWILGNKHFSALIAKCCKSPVLSSCQGNRPLRSCSGNFPLVRENGSCPNIGLLFSLW